MNKSQTISERALKARGIAKRESAHSAARLESVTRVELLAFEAEQKIDEAIASGDVLEEWAGL